MTLLEEMQKELRIRKVWEALRTKPDEYTYADLERDLRNAAAPDKGEKHGT